MRYLSAEEILVLHACAIDKTGGSHGIRDLSLLQSIVHKPQSRFGGKELYNGIFAKAAILLEAIVNYHVFVDGNKRTGLICMARFLELNGHTMTATNKEIEEIVLFIATKDLALENIGTWLKKHSRKSKRSDRR